MHGGAVRRRGARAASRRRPRRTSAYGVLGVDQREPQQLEARPVLLQQRPAGVRVGDGGELEHHRQVVGQLAVGVDEEAAGPVALLEPPQHLAAAAGVAVGPVGQVERVLAGEVEHLDVAPLQARRAGWLPRWSTSRPSLAADLRRGRLLGQRRA